MKKLMDQDKGKEDTHQLLSRRKKDAIWKKNQKT